MVTAHGTHLVQTVEDGVSWRHRSETATRPPVCAELGLELRLVDLEDLGEVRDVLRGQFRLGDGQTRRCEAGGAERTCA